MKLHSSFGKFRKAKGAYSDDSTETLCAFIHALANQLSVIGLSSALLRRQSPANLTPAQLQDCSQIENSLAECRQIISRLIRLIETLRQADGQRPEPSCRRNAVI